jgi:hypothetical protein
MSGCFEKSEHVLWAFMPNGIVLHNFKRREFIELTDLDAQVWAYCDGSRTLTEICSLLATNQNGTEEALHGRIQGVFDQLLRGGFLAEREQ